MLRDIFGGKGILPLPTVAAELALSTTCSGLETPVVVARIATQAIAPNVTVKRSWACERNRAFQEEMLQNPSHCPDCMYSNVADFLPDAVKVRLSGISPENFVERRNLLMGAEMKCAAWCIKHGSLVYIKRADIHIFVSPCVHDS
jgi:hypothetical protein